MMYIYYMHAVVQQYHNRIATHTISQVEKWGWWEEEKLEPPQFSTFQYNILYKIKTRLKQSYCQKASERSLKVKKFLREHVLRPILALVFKPKSPTPSLLHPKRAFSTLIHVCVPPDQLGMWLMVDAHVHLSHRS